MSITNERRSEIVGQFGESGKDTGKTEVQIALMTERINDLTKHFKTNPKDFHSRRGLLKIVGRRRRLLDYLKSNDIERYRSLIKELGIRR
jgi:small subunit ribosomal protein S15